MNEINKNWQYTLIDATWRSFFEEITKLSQSVGPEWMPFGGIATRVTPSGDSIFTQAFVRELVKDNES